VIAIHRLDQPGSHLGALTSWWMIGALVVLGAVEFFADKIPAVNHANDVIQTFVRPAAARCCLPPAPMW
jgi:hypothetical protein